MLCNINAILDLLSGAAHATDRGCLSHITLNTLNMSDPPLGFGFNSYSVGHAIGVLMALRK